MPPVPHQDPKIGNRPCSECRRCALEESSIVELYSHVPRWILRLKVKCDKKIPCSNCARRGVSSICPDGSLTYGPGRFVLSGTEELHTQVQQLSMRVKKLEAALEAAHNLVSTETHPLLAETERVNLLVETDSPSPAMEGPDMNDELAGQFSMLAIEGDVKTSRFTTSQYSLWFLDGQADPHHAPSMVEQPAKISVSRFPVEILRTALGPYEHDESLHQNLISCLPPVHVALSLIDAYYTNSGCLQNIIPQSLLQEEFWPVAYEGRKTNTVSLAVIFGLLCIGAHFHLPVHPEALSPERYLHLSILAISQDPLSIVHIEALFLQASYMCVTDLSLGKPTAILGLMIKCCQTLGIDHECPTWRISEQDKQRRRRIFHEVHSFDCFLSMNVGRCNFLSKGQHNTPLPCPLPDTTPSEVIPFDKACKWKYLFLGQGVQALLDILLSTCQKATYDAVLSLDKKLRGFDSILDPTYLREMGNWTTANGTDSGSYDRKRKLQQQFILLTRECTLVHLHRGFLNRALLNPSEDPILSKWSISVMAAYQSACSVIRQVRLMGIHQPDFLRLIKWTNAVLSASIALAALVIRTPFSSLATVAFQELQSGCELLRTNLDEHSYIKPVLARLGQAAAAAYASRDQHPLKATAEGLHEVRRPIDDPISQRSASLPTGIVSDPAATTYNNTLPFVQADNNNVFSGTNPLPSSGTGTRENITINGGGGIKEVRQTHPAGLQEVIGAYLQPPEGTLDHTFFSSEYPAEPDQGGSNWHFLLPSIANSDSPPSASSNSNEQVSDYLGFSGPISGFENGVQPNNSLNNGAVGSNGLQTDANFWAELQWNAGRE